MTLKEFRTSPDKLRVIPLGGVVEIGKNMTAYEYGGRILVVDAGLMFPEEEMLGVDIVIPDITYLEDNRGSIEGIILTHGHEDHIGALPYVLKRLDVPVYATRLTLGLLANKLDEHRLTEVARLFEVEPGDTLELGPFNVELFRVAHSIPDAAGLILHSPAGTVVHVSDFKFDQSPVDGRPADMGVLARTGEDGVLLFMCDTTNVEKTGFTPSEAVIGESLERIFFAAPGRIIVASFASNLGRIQQVYNIAAKLGRRVAVVGRSMAENSRIAEELGYLKVPNHTRLLIGDLERVEANKTVIVTTGSQGEPLSALSKMAMDEHKNIKIQTGDTVIISATAIPGNEGLVMRTVNRLFRQGAEVVYEPYSNVHVSGHGNQEDIKLMMNFLRPKFVVPVHGEDRHIARFGALAESMGYPRDHIFRLQVGDVLELDSEGGKVIGRVASGSVMVDGLGVGDVEDVVLRDRGHLAKDGVLIAVIGLDVGEQTVVTGPEMLSRGFAGEDHVDDLMEDAKTLVLDVIQDYIESESLDQIEDIRITCRKVLAKFMYDRMHRRPVIIPVIMEV